MLLEEVAAASADVAATSSRRRKVERLSSLLAALRPDEVPIAVAYLSGVLPQGTVGVGWASLRARPAPAESASLTLLEVDAAMARLQAISGAGSQAARRAELEALLGRATETE